MTVTTRAIALLAAVLYAAAAEPIRLHPKNPHYFLYRGRAVALIASGEHYGAVMNADFDYHRYLAALAAEGMNYTRLFGGSYREVPAKSFGIRRNTLAAPYLMATVTGALGASATVTTTGTLGPAVTPAGTCAFTWYSPTYPGASPENVTGASSPPTVTVVVLSV